MSAEPRFRSVRAGVFASVCVGVSTAGHALAAGHEPSIPATLLGLALVFAFAWATAGRERGYAGIFGSMVWAQLALHLLLSLFPGSGTPAGGAGHLHAGVPSEAVAAGEGQDLPMLLAHLVAALVSSWWLRRGEAAAFALLRLVVRALLPLLLLLPVLPSSRPPARRRPRGADRATVALFLRHVLVLRGPPLPHAA
ncbi:hypothetical protein ACQEU5_18990 [Marinactinospora thermotolerans]|uniref:hypothetical protein n=1 Tax=Marinactinospora thermotolerans TaxID=531310 RepID=UPI003D8DDC30